MGFIAGYGALLLIGAVLFIICTVVGLFVGHIILFDSIALGLISGVCSSHFLTLHPAFCLLIGIAVFVGLLFLQHTAAGFWVIGCLLSAVWAFIFAFFAYIFTEDMIWFYVVGGIAFVVMLLLHIHARDKA